MGASVITLALSHKTFIPKAECCFGHVYYKRGQQHPSILEVTDSGFGSNWPGSAMRSWVVCKSAIGTARQPKDDGTLCGIQCKWSSSINSHYNCVKYRPWRYCSKGKPSAPDHSALRNQATTCPKCFGPFTVAYPWFSEALSVSKSNKLSACSALWRNCNHLRFIYTAVQELKERRWVSTIRSEIGLGTHLSGTPWVWILRREEERRRPVPAGEP